MTVEQYPRIDGMEFVCQAPGPVKRLAIENGCVVAHLENGELFLVPVIPHESELKN